MAFCPLAKAGLGMGQAKTMGVVRAGALARLAGDDPLQADPAGLADLRDNPVLSFWLGRKGKGRHPAPSRKKSISRACATPSKPLWRRLRKGSLPARDETANAGSVGIADRA